MKIHNKITDLLDNNCTLIDIDYQDNLDDNLSAVQLAIHGQTYEPLDTLILDDWLFEREADSVSFFLNELTNRIKDVFDVDAIKATEFVDRHREMLIDEIHERDDSTPLRDLIKNTQDPICFYDLGRDVDPCYYMMDEKEAKQELNYIKKALKIKANDSAYDVKLEMMLSQASYGGQLVVYFAGDIEDLLDLSDKNIVTFCNPMIAIIDSADGSGDHTKLSGHEFTISFSPLSIFLDRLISYSYTYDVCGLMSNWCDCTGIMFSRDLRYKILANHSTLEWISKTEFKTGIRIRDRIRGRNRKLYTLD